MSAIAQGNELKRAVYSLGRAEIEDLIEKQGQVELTCYFCNKSYVLTKDELKNMLNR